MTLLHPADQLLGTAMLPARPDESFERLARLAQRYLGVPLALVSLVSQEGQVHPGAAGLPDELDRTRFVPLSHSFCKHVVGGDSQLVVEDARTVDFLRDNPSISELGVIAYAGFPLTDDTDTVVGAMCVIDHTPRRWTADELALLEDLAAACSSELRLRGQRERARQAENEAMAASRQSGLLLLMSDAFQDALTVEDVAQTVARVAAAGIGASLSGVAIRDTDGRGLTYTSMEHFGPPFAHALQHAHIDDDRPVAQVARTREPLFFADHAEMVAAFPATQWDNSHGSGARVVLPLIAGANLIGVLTLGWDLARDFGQDNRILKTALAAYTAQALERAQLLEERRDVARTLQDAMLTALPQPARLQLAAHYLPARRADEVGGDWYDALELPDGGVAVMVGDVTGHDMEAAARMGQLRSTLRAFAWDRAGLPSTWLSRLDRANDGLRLGTLATGIAGRIDVGPTPGTHTLTWSSAGHPSPVLVRPGVGARTLDVDNDLMIGVVPETARRDRTCELLPGDTLLLYTDGLIERRDRPMGESIAALLATAGRLADLGPLELVTTLAQEVLGGDPWDDVALLAVQVRHPDDVDVEPGAAPRTQSSGR